MPTPGGEDPIRVLLVDDHPLVRRSLRLACDEEPRIRIVGEAATGSEALTAVEALEVDVVLLDLSLPDVDGLDVARKICEVGPPPYILVLTANDDPEVLFSALRVGVSGYVNKSDDSVSIPDRIVQVAQGIRLFTPEQERRARERLGRLVDQVREGARFSDREIEVLKLAADGLTTFEIGRRLDLSPRTVESHLARLYRKLGVRSRTAALVRARAIGLIKSN